MLCSSDDLKLSIVIPVINEANQIGLTLHCLVNQPIHEILVVDGGSDDGTTDIVQSYQSVRLTKCEPGRARQMNHGAARVSGNVVLFLHADNRPGPDLVSSIAKAIVSRRRPSWGFLRQRIDSPRPVFRLIEIGNYLRARWLSRVFGDQGIWSETGLIRSVGWFPDVPLMEDVILSNRLWRASGRPVCVNCQLSISPRRWEQYGVIRQTVRNWGIQARFALGAKPDSLVRRYRRHDA